MFEWDRMRPRWVQIHELIKARIDSGELASGDRVPGIHDLMREYGVANTTAQKVFKRLRDEGLIFTEPGMGSFVAAPEDRPEAP